MPSVLTAVVVIVLGFVVNLGFQRYLNSRYDYRCERCGATFSLALSSGAIAPHRATIAPYRWGGARYVKCPNCGNRSRVTPVPKG